MEYNKPIANIGVGDEVEGFYILKVANAKTSNSGKPFLAATLADKTGNIEAKVWDYGGPVGPADEGKVIKVRGQVSEYRGTLQIILSRIRTVQAGDVYDPGNLVPAAPIDPKAAYQELLDYVDSIGDPDYAAVCKAVLARYGDRFRTLPGGKSMHHGFIYGLVMHTLNMVRTADYLADLYADTVDRDLLLAGTVLHDAAKCDEFTTSELGLVTEYSVKGQLLGHLVLGAEVVAEEARKLGMPEEKSVLLQHLLLSHHGDPQFGAAVLPMCAESELLSLIDLIDSRMEIYRENLAETPAGQFSKRIFALDKKIYNHGWGEAQK